MHGYLQIRSLKFLLLISVLLLSSCRPSASDGLPAATALIEQNQPVTEAAVITLHLGAPLDQASAELSSLTWAEEWLILLPQYPSRFNDQIFKLDKQTITTALDNNPATELTPLPVKFNSNGLEKTIAGFEGYEAITTVDHTAYLTIEAGSVKTGGFLVRAEWNQNFDELTLDPDSMMPIEPQAALSNTSDESIMVFGQRIVTLYEANGANVNPDPVAHMFNPDLQMVGSLSMPTIEYRITDATQPDQNGLFWAINYFFPGDREKLNPAEDQLVIQYEQGETHAASQVVERLVAFQFSEDGIVLAPLLPIQLQLLPDDEARNWEGIVRLDQRGFLLVTDKFPETILAFVANLN
jgi:hypothetical protein